MKMPDPVKKAVKSARIAHVASSGADGCPHMAVSKAIEIVDAEHVAFSGWFCPQTDENLARNRRVAVAVWDPEKDHGYQLVGEVVAETVTAVLDGWAGKSLDNTGLPQNRRKLTVRVDAVLELKSGIHSDESLQP